MNAQRKVLFVMVASTLAFVLIACLCFPSDEVIPTPTPAVYVPPSQAAPSPTLEEPTSTATLEEPTLTPTLEALSFTPNINAYCRSGPDQVFESMEVAMAGQAYPMDGRNAENTWFRIMLSAAEGCWVSSSMGVASRDTLDLRVLVSPPTPTPTEEPPIAPVVNCAAYTSAASCNAQPVCTWTDSRIVRAYCKSK